nr:uncharacterized protein LOC123770201 [Procambarus clarkii]XP_045617832.1 uncharacterized protein LOC123770201 [Procambarus clarkii]
MAPVNLHLKTASRIARHVAEVAIKKISKNTIRKPAAVRRRSGASSGCGLKRVVDHAKNITPLLKKGLAKVKRDGITKVSRDFVQMATREILGVYSSGRTLAVTLGGSSSVVTGDTIEGNTDCVPEECGTDENSNFTCVNTKGHVTYCNDVSLLVPERSPLPLESPTLPWKSPLPCDSPLPWRNTGRLQLRPGSPQFEDCN